MAEHFSVTYDGPALRQHRIPVTELAPALLGLSGLFATAHRLVSDGSSLPPGLEVVASREGSFDVELVLDVVDFTTDLFNSPPAVAAASAITLVTPVVWAFRWIQHLRRLGNRYSIEPIEPGQIRVTWPDGTTLEAPVESQELVESMDFRRSARGALAPLDSNVGIETIAIKPGADQPDRTSVVLSREDAHELDRPLGDEVLLYEGERTVGLRPLKPSLEAGYKWWVEDGSSRFWVDMHDLAFLNRVENSSEAFSAGDILRCRLRDRQIQEPGGGLRMEHIVLEVLDHLRLPPADPIPGVPGA